MAEGDKVLEERKSKIKAWITDRYNLALIAVIIFAFAIRLYYFIVTKDQTLWWDEAEYMSTAKHWAFGLPYDLNPQRPPLFQLAAAALLYLGLSELTAKFLLVLVPSMFLVFIIYLLGKEMFDKRIGLFAALGSTLVWSSLFWTERFQPDFISVSFQVLSVLFFWKLFKEPKKRYAIYAGAFTALAFYFKISALLVPLAVLIFVLFKDGWKFVYKKEYWISFASFIAALVPFMIWQYINFGNPLAFAPSYIGGTGIGQGWALGWMTLKYFYDFPKILFFLLFLAGLGIALVNIVFSFDFMLKNKEKRLDARLFSIIILATITLFYIFYIRGFIEDRWVFLMIPFILYFSSLGFFAVSDIVRKYSKIIAVILLIAVIGFFAYYQLQHTTSLIDMKKESYSPVRDSALWIKENSKSSDSVLSVSYTQTTTYSERQVYTYARMSEENYTRLVMEKRPKYLVASIIEPNHPDWMIQQGDLGNGAWAIVLPYMNSSVIISNGQAKADLKPIVHKGNVTYSLVYPTKGIDGLFVYRIDYE